MLPPGEGLVGYLEAGDLAAGLLGQVQHAERVGKAGRHHPEPAAAEERQEALARRRAATIGRVEEAAQRGARPGPGASVPAPLSDTRVMSNRSSPSSTADVPEAGGRQGPLHEGGGVGSPVNGSWSISPSSSCAVPTQPTGRPSASRIADAWRTTGTGNSPAPSMNMSKAVPGIALRPRSTAWR